MIGFLALTLAMLFAVGVGTGLLWLAAPPIMRRDPFEQVFLGGFLGIVLITGQIFLYSLLGLARSFWSLAVVWVVVLGAAAAGHMLVRRARLARLKGRGRKVRAAQRAARGVARLRLSVLDIVLLVVLAGELFWIATMTVNEVVWGWDAMVIWARKAKIFYFESTPDFPKLPLAAYPLGVPLAQTWVFHCLGAWNDAVGKGFFILPFVLGGLGFYAVLRSLTGRTWALAATAALLATPRIFLNLTEGYADAFLALLYGPGVLLLCRWLVRGGRWDLWAGSLCLGMGGWIKAEGLPLGAIVLLIAVVLDVVAHRRWPRERWAAVAVAVVLVLFLGVAWQLAAARLKLGPVHGEGVYSFARFTHQLGGQRIGAIAFRIWLEMKQLDGWGLIWFVWPVAALVDVRRLVRAPSALLLLAVAADLALIFVIFITTGFELSWHLSAALDRLMIGMVPLLVALTTIQAHGLFTGGRRPEAQAAAPAE